MVYVQAPQPVGWIGAPQPVIIQQQQPTVVVERRGVGVGGFVAGALAMGALESALGHGHHHHHGHHGWGGGGHGHHGHHHR